VFDNTFSLLIRGEGGFGGDRGPEAVSAEPPDAAPAFTHTDKTSEERAALYRLSGDFNPLHIAPDMAKLGGFDRPILHGLCTYGHAGRAVLRHACGGDPARFRSLSARFSGVVFSGCRSRLASTSCRSRRRAFFRYTLPSIPAGA
jgi:acyl dehydratase